MYWRKRHGTGVAPIVLALVTSATRREPIITADAGALRGIVPDSSTSSAAQRTDPIPVCRLVVDRQIHLTPHGDLIECGANGSAFVVAFEGNMVDRDPVWRDGKPVKCGRDMFITPHEQAQ